MADAGIKVTIHPELVELDATDGTKRARLRVTQEYACGIVAKLQFPGPSAANASARLGESGVEAATDGDATIVIVKARGQEVRLRSTQAEVHALSTKLLGTMLARHVENKVVRRG